MAPAYSPGSGEDGGEVIRPTREDQSALLPLDAALQRAGRHKVVVRVGDDEFALPLRALEAFKRAVHELARGNSVQVVDVPVMLTTQQAADMLNVSRPYLCKLIDQGELPAVRVGSHRKIRLDDLLRFLEVFDAQRRKSLKQLTRLSEDLGIPF